MPPFPLLYDVRLWTTKKKEGKKRGFPFGLCVYTECVSAAVWLISLSPRSSPTHKITRLQFQPIKEKVFFARLKAAGRSRMFSTSFLPFPSSVNPFLLLEIILDEECCRCRRGLWPEQWHKQLCWLKSKECCLRRRALLTPSFFSAHVISRQEELQQLSPQPFKERI